jgi:hypothetical protein
MSGDVAADVEPRSPVRSCGSDYFTATRVSDNCTMSRQGKLKISAESVRRTARREQAI